MASTRRKQRVQYTDKQRRNILTAAVQNHLTARQVQQKFGVVPVTYYSWRRKMGLARPKGRIRRITIADSSSLNGSVRTAVRKRIVALMPGIVRREVNSYLDTLFANVHGRRRVRR